MSWFAARGLGLTVARFFATPAWRICCWEADEQKVEAARAAGAPVFHGDASRPDTCWLPGGRSAHGGADVRHAQQALRIAQAIAERRAGADLVGVMQKYDRGRCIRAMPNVRVYQQSFAAAIGAGGTGDVRRLACRPS